MKQVVFWGLLLAAVPARAAAPDSTAAAGSQMFPTPAEDIQIGNDRMRAGNYVGAAYKYHSAIEKDPSNPTAYIKLGRAYTKAGATYPLYFSKAESTYAELVTLVGKNNVEYRKAIAELDLAQWKVDDAISIYAQLTTEHPDSCGYWMLLGDAYRMQGLQVQETEGRDASVATLAEAEKNARKAMAVCPDRIEPVQLLAAVMDTRKSYEEVVSLYEVMLKKDPGRIEYLRGYAIATFNARDWEVAAQSFADLLKKDPRFEERMMYIAALRKLNRLPEAEEQERIARQEAPKYYGPVELTQEDILKEKLGFQKDVEQGVDLITKGQCDAAVTLWKGTKTRIEPYLQDPEFKDAADDLMIFLDRRILYAQGKCK